MNPPLRKPSTSCANCRAVKRRCDEKRPHCSQCVRLNQECPGYRDKWELVFRDQTKKTIQRTKQVKILKIDQPDRSPLSGQYRDEIRQPVLLQTVPSGIMVSSQIFSSYIDNYFPRKGKANCVVNLSFPIISAIYMLPEKSPMLQKATSALSCIFLGKINRDDPILQYGIGLYNEAICELSKTLSLRNYTPDLIYTCALFEQIEAHYCPDSLDKLHAHIDGLSAIMRLYRPKKDDSHIISLIYGQHQKIRVLLSRLMHLTEPVVQWLREPGEGLQYELIQLLTDMSCFAAALDSAHRDPQTCRSLLDNCLALEKRHLEFYTKINGYGVDEDPPIYNCGEIKAGLATDNLYGPAYKFLSVGEANLHMFIWTSLSLLYPIIYRAYTLTEAGNVPNLLRVDNQSPQHVAQQLSIFNISKAVRCIPYCTQEGLNLWSLYCCIFPAIQATRVFSQNRDWNRFLWASEVFQYIARSGFDVAARYHELCCLYWFEPSAYGTSSPYRLPNPYGLKKG